MVVWDVAVICEEHQANCGGRGLVGASEVGRVVQEAVESVVCGRPPREVRVEGPFTA